MFRKFAIPSVAIVWVVGFIGAVALVVAYWQFQSQGNPNQQPHDPVRVFADGSMMTQVHPAP